MRFAQPWLLLLIPVAWMLLVAATRWFGHGASLRFSSLRLTAELPSGWRARSRVVWSVVRALALAALIVGMAQPQVANNREVVEGEGIDIALVLDISGSMRALDFEPDDRLAVAKRVMKEFVDGRTQDRVSLVVFAAKAFTQCPLTLDYEVLKRFLDEVQVGLIEDGTAIGLGIATGVKRLARSEADSKVLVLLTDGVNNVTTVDPTTAADAAKSLGVRVYAVGVGREGMAPYPVDHPVLGRRYTQIETHIDEELLQKIAQQTGGQYFRAQSGESLESIFELIDELETTTLETTIFTNYRQMMVWFVIPAVLLLMLEALAAATIYRVVP